MAALPRIRPQAGLPTTAQRVSTPVATIQTPQSQVETAAPASKTSTTLAVPATAPAASPTGPVRVVASFLSGLVGSVLNPFAAGTDNPVPTDSPAAWTLLAYARREFSEATTPSAVAATPATLTVATAPTTAAPATPSPLTSLISPIATVVFNVFDSVFAAVAGPPVLPPGSTVTVQSSTLQYDNGYVAPADWYFPADANPKSIIYLQHGFLAQGPIYSYTAAALAEQTHSIVVAPTITSNFFAADGNWLGGSTMPAAAANLFLDDRAALVASASAAAGHPVTLPQKVVLAGHSLGGGFVTAMAGDMVDNETDDDLAAVILLDGVAFDPDVPATTLHKLPNSIPVLLIASDPYFWNLYGSMSDSLSTLRPGQFNGVQLVGGLHIDALQGGNPLIQFSEYVVAGFSQPKNVEAVKILATGWINDILNGTDDGYYADPGQPIQIPTTAGIANAFAVPAPPTPLSPIDELVKALEAFGNSVFFNL